MKRKTRKNKRQVTRKKRSRGGMKSPSRSAKASDTKTEGYERRKAARASARGTDRTSAIATARTTIRFEDDDTLTVLNPFSGAGFIFGSSASGKAYKIVIVSPDNNFKRLDPLRIEWGGRTLHINKIAESNKSFIAECNTTKMIYDETSKNGYPACFNPYDFFNRNNEQGKELLKKLLEKTIDLPAKAMLKHILDELTNNPSFSLQAIGMEKAPDDYATLNQFTQRTYISDIIKQQQVLFAAALLPYIYILTNILNLDFRFDNIMGKLNEWKSIDFGTVFNGRLLSNSERFTDGNGDEIITMYNMYAQRWKKTYDYDIYSKNFEDALTYINTDLPTILTLKDDAAILLLNDFFKFASLIDFCNRKVFNPTKNFPMMTFILQYIYGTNYIGDNWVLTKPVFFDSIPEIYNTAVKQNLIYILNILHHCAPFG